MKGKWVTVDNVADKKEKERVRKERKKEEEEQRKIEEKNAALASGEEVLMARLTRLMQGVKRPPPHKATPSDTDKTSAARAAAREEKEEEKRATRRAAAHRSRPAGDASQWPSVAEALKCKINQIKEDTIQSMCGAVGADCSYGRALHAATVLERHLQNCVPVEEERAVLFPREEHLPFAAVDGDDDARKLTAGFVAKYFRFDADGDELTMFNVFTAILGQTGSREFSRGCGQGSRLALQWLIANNARLAMGAMAKISDAFCAVESNFKFHSAASCDNFCLIASTLLSAAVVAMHQDKQLRPPTVKNALVCVLRAFSNDGCSRSATRLQALEVVKDIHALLCTPSPHWSPPADAPKSRFNPLLVQDVQFLLSLVEQCLIPAADCGVILVELTLSHHPDAPRALFSASMQELHNVLLRGHLNDEQLDGVTRWLSLMVQERGADVFPSWGECFCKSIKASWRVLHDAAEQGAVFDRDFLEKAMVRLASGASAISPQDLATAKAILFTVMKKGKLADLVPPKKGTGRGTYRKGQDGDDDAAADGDGDIRSTAEQQMPLWKAAVVTAAKIGVTVGIVWTMFQLQK